MSIHSQNTSNTTRHVGTYGDKRVAIIIQDPQETHEVHIIDTDSLPDAYHQNLMDLMMRPEAQASKWLGEYLHRQMLFDGTNALRQFYDKGWIQQVPVTSVYLTPRPNQQISLAEVLGIAISQGESLPVSNQYNPLATPTTNIPQEQSMDDIVAQEQAKLDQFNGTHNQHAQNLQGDVAENNRLIAANLIAEAKMLESDAAAKRATAAQYDSSVSAPVATFTPPTTVNVPVMDATPAVNHTDLVTGKSYSSASALKGAITRRENAAKKAGNG